MRWCSLTLPLIWVRRQLPPGDLAAPLSPPFLQALAAATNRRVGTIDVLCVTESLPGSPPVELTAEPVSTHARVRRALSYRDEVQTWRADGGVVLLGRGVGGRLEMAVEVDPDQRGQGLGRRLITAARHLTPTGTSLWAQVAPGNAASLRAFLAAGFVPVGAEVLLAVQPEL